LLETFRLFWRIWRENLYKDSSFWENAEFNVWYIRWLFFG